MCLFDILVAEHGFYEILAIVKCAIHGYVVNVFIKDRSHLHFLHETSTTLPVDNDDTNVLFYAKALNGCGAGVAAYGADDGEVFALGRTLVLVAVGKGVFKTKPRN